MVRSEQLSVMSIQICALNIRIIVNLAVLCFRGALGRLDIAL